MQNAIRYIGAGELALPAECVIEVYAGSVGHGDLRIIVYFVKTAAGFSGVPKTLKMRRAVGWALAAERRSKGEGGPYRKASPVPRCRGAG